MDNCRFVCSILQHPVGEQIDTCRAVVTSGPNAPPVRRSIVSLVIKSEPMILVNENIVTDAVLYNFVILNWFHFGRRRVEFRFHRVRMILLSGAKQASIRPKSYISVTFVAFSVGTAPHCRAIAPIVGQIVPSILVDEGVLVLAILSDNVVAVIDVAFLVVFG